MRHRSIVASICVALMAGLATGSAFAADKNDKKAAVPPNVTEEYRLGAGDKLRMLLPADCPPELKDAIREQKFALLELL